MTHDEEWAAREAETKRAKNFFDVLDGKAPVEVWCSECELPSSETIDKRAYCGPHADMARRILQAHVRADEDARQERADAIRAKHGYVPKAT